MKIESNKNWTTCLRLNTGDGSPRVFLLNSHFLGSVPFYFVLFFSLIAILCGCSGRNSRAYLEDRIGNQISRVYPTKNLEDLFEQFPNGFTIYQGYLLADKIIKIELDGNEKGKPITMIIMAALI